MDAGVGLMHIEGLVIPDGIVTIKKKSFSVRELFLKALHEDKPMILSITKKWQSTAWHAVYIKKYDKACMKFTSCAAAWFTQGLTKAHRLSIFKHSSPEAVTKANTTTWDSKTKRMITPTEKEALAEEDAVSNISWMVDLTAHFKMELTLTLMMPYHSTPHVFLVHSHQLIAHHVRLSRFLNLARTP